ncbi:DUF1292 domain-containing protein [Clostridium sp. AL.422]|uniref:DUF1292 domain-containing protein n=1 Tax=Clostridium TaxID=1485 RepID=UPI00293DA7BF|nr:MULTISPECIES: DUF1292 domain-containing protein [unclassified Clostridium]MDV4151420.1 DUF1292 domain-containing protein [Clostridium sp. AL.422]
MSNTIDFINNERDTIGKTFTEITYAISEVSPFLDSAFLRRRKYYSKLPILKNYIDMLDDAEYSSKNKKFRFFSKDDSVLKLEKYKQDNLEVFNQMQDCSKCTCLNCIKECDFKSCSGCRVNSYIKSCDKSNLNVRFHKNFILDLTNNNTGKSNRYKVLATIENCIDDKLYIALENLMDNSDKLLLYYYPGISSDDFGEITDEEEFNLVVETYEQA